MISILRRCRRMLLFTPLLFLSLGHTIGAPMTLMTIIPAGSFTRHDGQQVQLSRFSLSACELTMAEWDTVRAWAIEQGYDLAVGTGSDRTPVANITWYDAVKFCNAASEMQGRVPVYYLDAAQTQVYRSGQHDVTPTGVKWTANGYRLPTEAEWEYACHAGSTTRYFWGDQRGNQFPYAWPVLDKEEMATHEVGLLRSNAFGLHDMSGNVFEWCWDWYQPAYNSKQSHDPKGATTGIWRIMRGGSIALDSDLSSAMRNYAPPTYQLYETGMRLASSDPACPALPYRTDIIAPASAPVTDDGGD